MWSPARSCRERLWPADTYVGFDEGLNTAIRKLRTAFGDSAGNPRFIETLPRRGYRFIAPVTETMPADGFPASMEVRGDGAQIEGPAAVETSGSPQQVERPPTACRSQAAKEDELFWSPLFWFWFSPLLHTSCTGILPRVLLQLNARCLRYYPFKI